MPPTSRRLRARRTVAPALAAMLLAGCTGAGGTEPSPSPTAVASTADPASPTTNPSTLPPSPTATAEPTPTATAGIEPPTEAPSEFGEFVIPAPDQLTEEYAAWVLAVFTRAEDELTRLSVEADDKSGRLPDDVRAGLNSLYSGDSRASAEDLVRSTIEQPASEEPFVSNSGATHLSQIELLDATQECLLVRYVEDASALLKAPSPPTRVISLFKPKPELDGSDFNRSPWLLTNRAVPDDVTGSTCG